MLGILSWIIMGLIIGALAKFAMPGRDPGGCIVTILLGVAGAFVGGFLANLLGFGSFDAFSPVGIGLSVVGAMVLLVIYRMLVGR
ncbi:MAG: GlsB/YeaQ/YmgE family stress response membrane protein [Anaerolineae bacterium]|nr:GlsB/YeaQ/YmgE family stress response membrane protein [Anaerolineae bacterium]